MTGRPGWREDDRGMFSGFVAILAVGLVFVAGLAWDGGQYIKTYVEANNLAEAAARAGAQASDPGELLVGRVGVDAADARVRVAELLSDAGQAGAGETTVSAERVTVTVTLTQQSHILPLGPRRITATASATPTRGVEEAAP